MVSRVAKIINKTATMTSVASRATKTSITTISITTRVDMARTAMVKTAMRELHSKM